MKSIFRFFQLLLPFAMLLSLSSEVKAQVAIPEYLYLSVDKPFYVSGEDLWYGLYMLNPEQRVSGIAYVELNDSDGETVVRQRLNLGEGVVAGDLALPASLETGYYTLRAYTRWNLGFEPLPMESRTLAIYQPVVTSRVIDGGGTGYSPKTEGLSLELSSNRLSPREELSVDIVAANGHAGVLSMSVVHEEVATRDYDVAARYDEVSSPARYVRKSGNFEPEEQFTQTFELKDPNGDPISSSFIVGFIRQSQTPIQGTAKDGRVTLSFSEVYDSTVIQLFDANPFKQAYLPQVRALDLPVIAPPAPVYEERPPFTPNVEQYIRKHQQRYQLGRLLRIEEEQEPMRTPLVRRELKPDLEFPITDFIPMESLEDFANQAVPPLQVKPFRTRSKKEPRVMGMDDPSKSLRLFVPHRDVQTQSIFETRPPLLMVNGYLTYDLKAVLRMDWGGVEQLDIYNNLSRLPYMFGPIGNFGVVAFQTRDEQTPRAIRNAPNNVHIQGYYRGRTFEPVRTDVVSEDGSRLPDFRSVIAWQPLIPMASGGIESLTLAVGDQTGRYLVRVEGMLDDGTPVIAEQWIEVSH